MATHSSILAWRIPGTEEPSGLPSMGSHRVGQDWNNLAAAAAFSSVQFSRTVVFDSLQPHESQHARPPCPSPTPRVHLNPCPLSWWCHPTISSSVVPFSSCPQSFPASGSFPMSQLFKVMEFQLQHQSFHYTQDWSPLGWTGWLSLQSKGLSSSSIVETIVRSLTCLQVLSSHWLPLSRASLILLNPWFSEIWRHIIMWLLSVLGFPKYSSRTNSGRLEKRENQINDVNDKHWTIEMGSLRQCVCMLVTQLCPTLWDSMDCSPPSSSVHGIHQSRTWE